MEKNKPTWKLAIVLAVITVLASGLVILSHGMTAEKIEQQKRLKILKSLHSLIPATMHDNDLLSDPIEIFEPIILGHRKPMLVYVGTKNQRLTGIALPVLAQDGYSGDIELMVGIDVDGKITGVNIIAHKETPGLGDLVDANKSDWLLQFPEKSLRNTSAWKVKKDGGDFDQITAATITPRAIVKAIKKALNYYKNNQHKFKGGKP
ncbi:MAG: electron transport complex subunit RsxG [Proteobacteria bacterium]|nr:electron transport complex subunit RsxG [Pseudomonadota bacterium]